ncbi:hypothetical protein CDD83_9282 [Cordyceps sp. RAO-2017]|nr:hypothetical protein CDD83_9282 [Cordyceps sp. RAO-2017]
MSADLRPLRLDLGMSVDCLGPARPSAAAAAGGALRSVGDDAAASASSSILGVLLWPYPPDSEEKQKKLGDFFGTYPPPKIAGYVPDYVRAVKDKNPSVSKMGILGYCWGGKVVALSTRAADPFAVAAAIHPAMVDPADAAAVAVPTLLLASKDEPAADVAAFEAALKTPKHVETFPDQIHGWMAARGDLSDPRVRAEYERGYKTVLTFFEKHL